VGVPVVHAAHCGELACAMPWVPIRYRGHIEGGASVSDAHGRVLVRRDRREGPGHAIADVEPLRVDPELPIPDRFWLHRRGPVAALAWNVQRAHGRRWYPRHVAGRPPAAVSSRVRIPTPM